MTPILGFTFPPQVRMVAAMRGHVEVVRLLLETGADKDRADKEGTTALTLGHYGSHSLTWSSSSISR